MSMKKIILSTIFIFVLFPLFAQRNHDEAIQQGDSALEHNDYTTAIKKYLIAEKFDQSKWKIVQGKLDAVYVIIDKKQEELKDIVLELDRVIAEKEKLDHKLSSAKEDVEQVKQEFEHFESQIQNALKTMNIQIGKLENRLNINNN